MESLVVNYGGKPCYEIMFEKDFEGLSDKVRELGFEGRKIAIITDSNVEKLYAKDVQKELNKVSKTVITYAIPAGEENKNLKEIEKIYKAIITISGT